MIYKVFHKYRSYFYLQKQMEYYKTTLKKKIVWLLSYNDPNLKGDFPDIDSHEYFVNLMKEISGLNELLCYPQTLPQIMSLLEASELEKGKDIFNWSSYRKLVLDAHALIDTIGTKGVKSC